MRDPTSRISSSAKFFIISIHRSLAGPDPFFIFVCDSRLLFQSTGPLRDPTLFMLLTGIRRGISIHRSLAGPDIGILRKLDECSISIHRSLAGPDPVRDFRTAGARISIHRSLAGPDARRNTPGTICSTFQSTGPLRDPTGDDETIQSYQPISIHRSLAGPDRISIRQAHVGLYFNPQVPCGTRRSVLCWKLISSSHFNPQVPCGTRQTSEESAEEPAKISIHRSLAGPDGRKDGESVSRIYFNPQVPCGTRRVRFRDCLF